MSKKQIKNALDSVQPDPYLESRLKAKINENIENTQNSKSPLKIALAITAVCTAIAIVLGTGFWNTQKSYSDNESLLAETTESTAESSPLTAKLIVMASASEADGKVSYTPLEINKEIVYEVFVKCVDIRGYSKEEREKAIDRLQDEYHSYIEARETNWGRASARISGNGENVLLLEYDGGSLKILPEQLDEINNIYVENSSHYASVAYDSQTQIFIPYPQTPLTITGEEFDVEKACFAWHTNDRAEELFNENPQTPYSALNDTITFTVNYKNGAVATCSVELTFNEDGSATAKLVEN